jgi:UDP-N-acetylmuramate dehydrogenase
MQILENYDLTKLNSFGVKVYSRYFVEINIEQDFIDILESEIFKNEEKLFLGGGSNILFTKDFDGLVVANNLKGIIVLSEDEISVSLRSMGGELWHDLVLYTVDHNLWGIENLALIPGTVGASPVQNIGAYGVELKDVIKNIEAIDIASGIKRIFTKEECNFGYRDSIFKNELKDKYFITSITLELSKKEKKNIEYRVLKDYIHTNNLEINTAKDVSDAVANIRRSKLPDPKILGNAGSFFKNVYIDQNKLDSLLQDYPEMPYFTEGDKIKIPTAWLVESCGFKGTKFGNVGVHDKQALILVNYGGGEGLQIKNLAEKIIVQVFEKFGIKISPEVNLH